MRSILGLDWRKSEAHLLLLSKFLRAKPAEKFARADYWKDVLGETPQRAIKRFVNEGVLVSPGLSEHLGCKYKVSELKAMLKQRGLPVSGRKDVLISRLIEADPRGMKKAVAGLKVLQCSDRGQEIASQYLASKKEEREAVRGEVLAMLQKCRFREASLLVASYEAKQPFPRGLNVDWKNYDPGHDVAVLKKIFGSTPKALSRMDQGRLGPLRLAAGMQFLGASVPEGLLPHGFERDMATDSDSAVLRILRTFALMQVQLEEYRRGGVRYVYIMGHDDDQYHCPACRELVGKAYKLEEVPELPYEKCTSELGCRCMVLDVGILDGCRPGYMTREEL